MVAVVPPLPCAVDPGGAIDDARFIALLGAFRSTGGLATLKELGYRTLSAPLDNELAIMQVLAQGKLFALRWNGEPWFPIFQFQRPSMAPDPAMQDLLAVLAETLDAPDIAQWLVRSNRLLNGQSPASALRAQSAAVLRAARAAAADAR